MVKRRYNSAAMSLWNRNVAGFYSWTSMYCD